MSKEALLQVDSLRVQFGGVVAVDGVSLSVQAGQVVGIIGANGAGKTTFVNMVTGWLAPTSGSIKVGGREVAGLPPMTMARAGVTRSFQIPQVFTSLTAAENVALSYGLAENSWRRLLRGMSLDDRPEKTQATLARFGLQRWSDRRVSEMPQGARKLLDIAMSLTRQPALLLLDEPTSGVPRDEKFPLMDQVFDAIGPEVTILFVEHDMEVISRYAQRVAAFVQGRIVADGCCAEVLANETVRQHVVGHEPAVVPG